MVHSIGKTGPVATISFLKGGMCSFFFDYDENDVDNDDKKEKICRCPSFHDENDVDQKGK